MYIPKTHAERITDTVTLIPNIILIPNTTIELHLRRTADDLLHLLQDKPSVVTPMQNTSVQGALIKIAQLLHRDTTPTSPHLPIHKSTSEGATPPIYTDITTGTSEGEQDITRFKTSIDPVIPVHTPLHPALYKQRSPPVPI